MRAAFSHRFVRQYDDYRFYFKIEGDTYLILSVIPHPK
jgi:hypothetical protein